MDTPAIDTNDALALAQENYRLNLENNEMLKKAERRYVRGIWWKVVWFIVLFVLPLLFLPYFFNSYLSTLGLAGETGSPQGTKSAVSNAQQVLDLLQNNQSNPR
jgi:hypothetical protein